MGVFGKVGLRYGEGSGVVDVAMHCMVDEGMCGEWNPLRVLGCNCGLLKDSQGEPLMIGSKNVTDLRDDAQGWDKVIEVDEA